MCPTGWVVPTSWSSLCSSRQGCRVPLSCGGEGGIGGYGHRIGLVACRVEWMGWGYWRSLPAGIFPEKSMHVGGVKGFALVWGRLENGMSCRVSSHSPLCPLCVVACCVSESHS